MTLHTFSIPEVRLLLAAIFLGSLMPTTVHAQAQAHAPAPAAAAAVSEG